MFGWTGHAYERSRPFLLILTVLLWRAVLKLQRLAFALFLSVERGQVLRCGSVGVRTGKQRPLQPHHSFFLWKRSLMNFVSGLSHGSSRDCI